MIPLNDAVSFRKAVIQLVANLHNRACSFCAQMPARSADGKITKLMACAGCKGRVRYCSAVCQGKDWKTGHKARCEIALLKLRNQTTLASEIMRIDYELWYHHKKQFDLLNLAVSFASDAWLDRAIPNQPVTMVFEYVVNAESTRNRFRLQLIDIHNDIPVQMSAEALKQEKARQATTGVDAKRHGRVRVPVRNMMIAPDDTTVCLQGAIIEETSKFRDWRREHGDSLPDCWHEVMVNLLSDGLTEEEERVKCSHAGCA